MRANTGAQRGEFRVDPWHRGKGVFRGASQGVVHWYHSEGVGTLPPHACKNSTLLADGHQLRAPFLIESVALRACAVVAMSALDEYESEYRSHIQAAEEKLEHAEQAIPQSDSRRAAISNAERAAEAAKDVVQLMELEGRTLSGGGRTKLQNSLRGYRSEIAALRERLKALRQERAPPSSRSSDQDRIREECFAGGGGYGSDSAAERSRMLANNERLGKAGERLKEAHQVTIDMENTANSILGDLSKQRETLMHAKGTLKYASEGLDASKRILSQMARRAAMNKAAMYVVIGLLIGMILLLMFAGGGGSGGDSPQTGGGGVAVQGAGPVEGWQKTNKAL